MPPIFALAALGIVAVAFYFGCLGPVAVLNDHIDPSSRLWKKMDVVFQPAYYVRDHGPSVIRDFVWEYIAWWDPYEEAELIMRLDNKGVLPGQRH